MLCKSFEFVKSILSTNYTTIQKRTLILYTYDEIKFVGYGQDLNIAFEYLIWAVRFLGCDVKH